MDTTTGLELLHNMANKQLQYNRSCDQKGYIKASKSATSRQTYFSYLHLNMFYVSILETLYNLYKHLTLCENLEENKPKTGAKIS